VDSLNEALHAAADDLPPTSIDLDRIIAGDRNRRHRQYRAGTVAGAAVLGLAAMTVPMLVAGSPGGGRTGAAGSCPGLPTNTPGSPPAGPITGRTPITSMLPDPSSTSGLPVTPTLPGSPGAPTLSATPDVTDPSVRVSLSAPQPTEDCAAASARLGADLLRMLHNDLPGVPLSSPDQSATFVRYPTGSAYVGKVRIGSGPSAWQLEVDVVAVQPGSEPDCSAEYRSGSNCQTDPDGTSVFTGHVYKLFDVIDAREHPDDPKNLDILDIVMIDRPDGTHTSLTLQPVGPAGPTASASPGEPDARVAPITMAQLADLGRGITLYP
jgi:hypothetical protein